MASPVKLPGFGLPLDHPHESPFVDLFSRRATAREISMLQLINQITDKPAWETEVFDEDIAEAWDEDGKTEDMSNEMMDWCIEELRDKANAVQLNGGIITVLDVYSGGCVAKSDTAVDSVLQAEIQDACQSLRKAGNDTWHPYSNGTLLELVDPFLHSLIYGVSRVVDKRLTKENCLDFCRDGETTRFPIEPEERNDYTWDQPVYKIWSCRFQWLPAEVKFVDGLPRFSSYINNLHPERFRHVYDILERLLHRTIPLWNRCLDKNLRPISGLRIPCTEVKREDPPPWIYGNYNWDLPPAEQAQILRKAAEPEGLLHWCGSFDYLRIPWEELDTANTTEIELSEWLCENRKNILIVKEIWKARWSRKKLIVPQPGLYRKDPGPLTDYEGNLSKGVDLCRDWGHDGLQIIIKIASRELTPEKPASTGTDWHVEGMSNEEIVAKAIYFYDMHNITEIGLQLRQDVFLDSTTLESGIDDYEGLETLFGLSEGDLHAAPRLQDLGSVSMRKGRLLAFTTHLQHMHEPFELLDKTKPGWCRFVVFCLVDPHRRILSTANVPPQQYDWAWERAERATRIRDQLPAEIVEMIQKEVKSDSMMLEQAKEYKAEHEAEHRGQEGGMDFWWYERTEFIV